MNRKTYHIVEKGKAKGGGGLSQWDKLLVAILSEDSSLRFEDLRKALIRIGYTECQPNGGGSHYTFRKPGCMPITIPRHNTLNRAYVKLVSDAVKAYLEEDSFE